MQTTTQFLFLSGLAVALLSACGGKQRVPSDHSMSSDSGHRQYYVDGDFHRATATFEYEPAGALQQVANATSIMGCVDAETPEPGSYVVHCEGVRVAYIYEQIGDAWVLGLRCPLSSPRAWCESMLATTLDIR